MLRPAATVADLEKAYREEIIKKLSAEMSNDPEGAYIRRWVPELQCVDAKFVHRPWEMSEKELATCKLKLGTGYPQPIVSHLKLLVGRSVGADSGE
eukprot:14686628-Alexandrium_andersonii.AAC.1